MGWAVALTSYISHSAKHRNMADFDPSGSQNPKPILMKLGMVDYIWDPIPHDNFGGGSTMWVVWANMWLATFLSFFSFSFFLFTVYCDCLWLRNTLTYLLTSHNSFRLTLQSLWFPAIWQHHYKHRGVTAICLQILSIGTYIRGSLSAVVYVQRHLIWQGPHLCRFARHGP